MLSYAAIVPHPPLAISSVGGEHAKSYKATRRAMFRVGEDLKVLGIETIVLLTPHGERYKDAMAIALHDPFRATVSEFGDMGLVREFFPDAKLADRLQRALRRAGTPGTYSTNEALDHASAVSLLLLEHHVEDLRLVPVTPSASSPRELVDLGNIIRDVIDEHPKRVALLASAELSGRLSELSPGGMHKSAEATDTKLRQAFADGNFVPLLKLSPELLDDIGMVGADALRLFVGVLGETRFRVEEYAYEAPLGVGHLTMAFHLL